MYRAVHHHRRRYNTERCVLAAADVNIASERRTAFNLISIRLLCVKFLICHY